MMKILFAAFTGLICVLASSGLASAHSGGLNKEDHGEVFGVEGGANAGDGATRFDTFASSESAGLDGTSPSSTDDGASDTPVSLNKNNKNKHVANDNALSGKKWLQWEEGKCDIQPIEVCITAFDSIGDWGGIAAYTKAVIQGCAYASTKCETLATENQSLRAAMENTLESAKCQTCQDQSPECNAKLVDEGHVTNLLRVELEQQKQKLTDAFNTIDLLINLAAEKSSEGIKNVVDHFQTSLNQKGRLLENLKNAFNNAAAEVLVWKNSYNAVTDDVEALREVVHQKTEESSYWQKQHADLTAHLNANIDGAIEIIRELERRVL